MAETTVALGKGQRAGKYGVSPDQILGAAARAAVRYGLGPEGAKVIQAILKTEGGLTGDVGDVEGGGSYGPTQLYWGGQLGNLARDLGVGLKEAAAWVQSHPIEAVDWSLGGYLGGAIRRGIDAGLTGADLATFAQKHGQVSVSPERAGAVYRGLFGGGGGLLGLEATPAEAAEADPAPPRTYRPEGEIDPTTPGIETQQGGRPMAQSPQAAPKAVIDPTLSRLVQAKGEWSSVYPVNPEIDNPTPPPKKPVAAFKGDPDLEEKTAAYDAAVAAYPKKIPNPNPTYRYVWDADGTYVDVKAEGGETPRYTVLPGGTAIASVNKPGAAGATVSTSANEPYIVTRMPDGALKQEPNPNYVPPKPGAAERPRTVNTATSEPFIVQEMPDGSTRTIPNPNYVPAPRPKAGVVNTNTTEPFIVYDDGTQRPNPNYRAPEGPKPTVHVAGNRVVTVGPDGKLTTQVIDPAADALAAQQANLNIQKTQQSLMPAQLLLIQNHAALIADMHKQVADPSSPYYGKPELADEYIAQSKAYMDAALQGTTPFDIKKTRDDNERMARQQGIDIVNQRLASSQSLANSLVSAASGLAQNALPMPGAGPINIDPLGYARQFVDDPQIGGGPELGDLARQLILAGRGQAPQQGGF